MVVSMADHDHAPDDLSYLESFSPGTGALPPRAALKTDAPTLSLDGGWRFRLAAGTGDLSAGFERPDFDDSGFGDSGFDEIVVPGSWQLQGDGRWGRPAYTNVVYPFPVDPPHVPDENPTGEYRMHVQRPDWDDGRVLLRFEGVDSCFRVWCNGTLLGDAKGSRLTHEFDVTDALVNGDNVIAVRVSQWSAGSYLEDQDMWWLSGIFRSVSLLHRPDGGIDDAFVHADWVDGRGVLSIDTTPDARLDVPELGIADADPAGPHTVDAEPWSAESPRLYDATLRTSSETVHLRIGFRHVEIDGERILVNGVPLMIRGVNRHEFHPETGRTLDEATMRRDIELMLQHNMNAVRTSHYPPDARFLDLCDEYGLFVMLECDLETHGFEPLGWRQNPTADERWTPALLDRMQRTVERDKNHASIISWSLGNESDTGPGLQAMADWARERDPDRFLHYEGDRSCAYTDVFSTMYASPETVAWLGAGEPEAERPYTGPGDRVPGQRPERSGKPFLQCEYAHAMGNGPGLLAEYRDLFEASDRLHGGFIWEWIDHGFATRDEQGRAFYGYGGDFGEPLHDGNFVTDGLLFPDRTPSPGLLEAKKVFEPVRLTIDGRGGRLVVENLRMHTDTADLRFHARLLVDGQPVAEADVDVAPLAPGERAETALPTDVLDAGRDATGERWVSVEAVLAADTPWAPAGHLVTWAEAELAPAAPGEDRSSSAADPSSSTTAGPGGFARFEGSRLVSLGGIEVVAPTLELFRAPTDNDLRPAWFEGLSDAEHWAAAGLHRLRHRVLSDEASDDGRVLITRTMAAAQNTGFDTTWAWTLADDEAVLDWSTTPFGDWAITLPRIGFRLGLPADTDALTWYGRGPGESYPDSREAARMGRFEASLDELQTPYVFPQDNGNRSGVRWFETAGLRVEAEPPVDVSLHPWTAETLSAARHPQDLIPDQHVWLSVDAAVHGLGTAACGPGVSEPFQLHARPARMRLTFRRA